MLALILVDLIVTALMSLNEGNVHKGLKPSITTIMFPLFYLTEGGMVETFSKCSLVHWAF